MKEVIVNKNLLIMTVFMLFTSISCKADGKGDYKVGGLNDEIYYRLNGSWHEYPESETVWYKFSWGRGKAVHDDLIIIDFGTDPPEFHATGTTVFDILSIETLGKVKYKLNLRGHWEKEEIGYFIIHTDIDEALWFENHFDFHYLMDGKETLYYKISGPDRPKN